MTPQSTTGLHIAAFAASDVGRVREQNEDSLFVGSTTFAVADGMGGHQAGEIASDLALQPIAELDGRQYGDAKAVEEALVAAITEANRAVVAEADANPDRRGMGTTLTVVLVRDRRLHVAHVGDSRAYLLRTGESISQLTTDHTLVEQLVREGRLRREDAATHPQRSVITRAIGADREVKVDILPPLEVEGGDQVLLCSDGLTGPVEDERITTILTETHDGQGACDRLVAAANDSGGPDNISVVLLRVGGAAGAASAPAAADDDTAHLGALPHEGAEESPDGDDDRGHRVPIRTREESDADWASSMGRYGAQQGVEGRRPPAAPEPGGRRGRARAVLAWLAGLLVLAGIVGVVGWLLLSRAFFLGANDGAVAIFQGLPQEVAGVALHRVVEDSDLQASALSPVRQRRLEAGITVESVGEGRRMVESWQAEVEEGTGDGATDPAAGAPATEEPAEPDGS